MCVCAPRADVRVQLGILADAPEMQSHLVSSHGMLAILEVLKGRASREVLMRLLQIINLVRAPLALHYH